MNYHTKTQKLKFDPDDSEYGWDIEELYSAGNKGGNDVFKCGGKDQGNKCSKTVMVSGKCYKVWAVNYYLFGRINSLCGEDVGTVTSAIAGYRLKKLFYGFINADEGIDPSEGEDWSRGTRTRRTWAIAGFNNNFLSGTEDAACEGCKTCPETSYKGGLTLRLRYSKTQHLKIDSNKKAPLNRVEPTPNMPPAPNWGI